MVDTALLVQLVVNGLILGSILALAGIGLTLVYGILNLANFAHGEFVTLGAFLSFLFGVLLYADIAALGLIVPIVLFALLAVDFVWSKTLTRAEKLFVAGTGGVSGATALVLLVAGPGGSGTSPLVLFQATLLATIATVAVVAALELVVWRPLRRKRATILTLVIVSIGVSLVVRNLIQVYFGTGNRSYDLPSVRSPRLFGAIVSEHQQFTLVATIAIIVLVHLFLKYTKYGRAMRALADNIDLARSSGIDVDRVVVYVWVLAAALTAVSGVLLTLVANNTMNVNMGFNLLLPLFAVVILGGIGSPYGAMVAGFLVGIAMKTSAIWIGTRYELVSALLLLTVVLLVRPQGIMGAKV